MISSLASSRLLLHHYSSLTHGIRICAFHRIPCAIMSSCAVDRLSPPAAALVTAGHGITRRRSMCSSAKDSSHVSCTSPVLSNFNFPTGILFAFAYGSAAFPQHDAVTGGGTRTASSGDQKQVSSQSQSQDAKMMDVVLVVRDSLTWHQENLTRNPSHYSLLFRLLGANVITWCQRKVKAHIYYNVVQDTSISMSNEGTDITCNSIKYGVIEYNDLMRDLISWNCLYVSGRMHKPIHLLFEDVSDKAVPELKKAIEMNRKSAVACSLILLLNHEKILTLDDLLMTITSLSYTGDFRMIIGEDRSKVEKIVASQRSLLENIYLPILKQLVSDVNEQIHYFEQSGQLTISFSDKLIIKLIQSLPQEITDSFGGIEQWSMMMFGDKSSLTSVGFGKGRGQAHSTNLTDHHKQLMSFWLKKAISNIVWSSSVRQSVKGFFSVGFVNALDYVSKKMGKMFSSIS